MQEAMKRGRLGGMMRAGWTRFVTQKRAPDPVALTVLAINRLGPATLRTAAKGQALRVMVPDAATGAIFRAALTETQKTRQTDRLIEIVVTGDQAA